MSDVGEDAAVAAEDPSRTDEWPIPPGATSGRAVDRFFGLTDGIVAVAATLLVLSIVNLTPAPDQTFPQLVQAHFGEIWSFLLTFYLVALLWLAHNRILNYLRAYDGAVFWLNVLWLLCIVLLPWLSAQFEVGRSGGEVHGNSGLTFWLVMAVASLATQQIAVHLRKNPGLLDPGHAAEQQAIGLARHRGYMLSACFILIGVATWFSEDYGPWFALLLIPVSLWLKPAQSPSAQGDG